MDLSISLACLFTILLAFFLNNIIIRRMKKRDLNLKFPPGPKKLPIIGNLHQIRDLNPHTLWLLSQKYGPLMHLKLGFVPILVVSSAEMAKNILKINDFGFCTRPKFKSTSKLSYGCKDISFAPYGENWREMRKLSILHIFSTIKINYFQSIREEEVSILINSISNSLFEPINLTKSVSTLISKIVCRAALNIKFDRGESEEEKFHSLLQEIEILSGTFFISDYFPSLGWIDKLTGLQQRLQKVFIKMDSFYDEIIEQHINQNRINPENDEDIIDVLLLYVQRNSPYINKANIKAILMDILAAGIGTSSSIIIWAMTELIKNSRIMQKAQEEVRNSNHMLNGDYHKLKYLNSIVKETLRLHLPAPLLLPREAISHYNINGYDIEPKTQVFINAWGIARDPNTWENPEEFLPERFIDNPIDFKGQDFEFIPFGSGRRICPGMKFGMASVEISLANLLYYFDWKLPVGMNVEEIEMDEISGIIVHKKSTLYLVASRMA